MTYREVSLLRDGGEVVTIGCLASVLHIVVSPGHGEVEPGHRHGGVCQHGHVLVLNLLALPGVITRC